MKIIIFDGSFKTTTFINRLIEGLANEHEVFVLGFNENTKIKIAGVHYIGLGSNTSIITFIIRSLQLRGFNIVLQCKFFLQLFNKEKNAIRSENIQMAINTIQPEIIHFQWVSVLSYLKNLKLPKHTKTILSQRGYHINVRPFINQDNKVFLNEVFSKLDGFHSVSNAIQKKSNEIYTSPLKIDRVVYSGFDEDLFRFKNTWNTNKKLQILSIGRNHWIKDYRTAINAMAILKKRDIQFHYTIIGIEEDEELFFMVSDLGLVENVSFISPLSQDKVYDKMIASDLLLLPSIEEGIANVCIEAMFCKLPVISTNCGGMEELIIHKETGFIIPIRNEHAMANELIEFYRLSKSRIETIVQNARVKVENQHSIDKMVNGIEELYYSVINK
ncbi:glycosyltransferase family 4 protein [Flavobacteriaceae bacterium]|jgi:colanic acid/amylovoran biosynthesis glycosyltransferase|nr:glycosyltransferase family 4 protein [Flavobacteriaceae bacterium]